MKQFIKTIDNFLSGEFVRILLFASILIIAANLFIIYKSCPCREGMTDPVEEQTAWADLDPRRRDLWSQLGWTEESWNNDPGCNVKMSKKQKKKQKKQKKKEKKKKKKQKKKEKKKKKKQKKKQKKTKKKEKKKKKKQKKKKKKTEKARNKAGRNAARGDASTEAPAGSQCRGKNGWKKKRGRTACDQSVRDYENKKKQLLKKYPLTKTDRKQRKKFENQRDKWVGDKIKQAQAKGGGYVRGKWFR